MRMGQHVWLLLATIATELLVIRKFSKGMFEPFPTSVKWGWAAGVTLLLSYTAVQVCLVFFLHHRSYPIESHTVCSSQRAKIYPTPTTKIKVESSVMLLFR